ncbi:MAG: tRNA threonylcarbamoyladenosine dehydratase [Eubacteriales bacterium]|nr:tRNA threonylcarbamoyladenosine dehydratase [Eubacteriales bacterium]
MNQYSRTTLLIGPKAIETLHNARVLIFGVGGVGGYAIEALARSGVGHMDLVDDDMVCLTNLNRQLLALRSTIGHKKADLAKERVHDIDPKIEVNVFHTFLLPDNADEFDFSKYDYVVDAVDTVTAKIEIIMRAKAAGVPVISCMGCGNRLDPTQIHVSDIYKTTMDPLAKVMRHEMRKRRVRHLLCVWSSEKPIRPDAENDDDNCRTHCVCPPGQTRSCSVRRDIPGSSAFVPPAAGLAIASTVVRELIAGC